MDETILVDSIVEGFNYVRSMLGLAHAVKNTTFGYIATYFIFILRVQCNHGWQNCYVIQGQKLCYQLMITPRILIVYLNDVQFFTARLFCCLGILFVSININRF